jgi:SpoVK/Ycf46/Vps4 family AAA+-type ATPase
MILDAKWVVDNEDEARTYGIVPTRRFLLLGIPGTGKSMICESAAHQLGYGLVQVGIARALNSFIGQSEANIRSMFDQIERLAPIVAWVDEIGRDLSGGSSSNYTDGGTTSRVHGEFLTRMQDLDPRVFFFAAANGLDHLSPEMLRAGRWDKMIYVGFPAYAERSAIFRMHLENLPNDFNYDQLAEATACWTGAEIVSAINETKNRIVPREHRPITHNDLGHTISTVKNLIWIKARTLVVESYRTALEQYEWASTAQYQEAHSIARGIAPNVNKTSRTVIG